MNGQKEKHGDKIEIRTLNVRDPESAKDLKEAAFAGGHGIVARNKAGAMVTKVDGHSYGEEKVEEVIAILLKEG